MDTLITPLSELIKIAVAPVFLLAGIAGFLNVMSGRLGRISDRVRVAERNIQTFADAERIQKNKREIIMLWRRVVTAGVPALLIQFLNRIRMNG